MKLFVFNRNSWTYLDLCKQEQYFQLFNYVQMKVKVLDNNTSKHLNLCKQMRSEAFKIMLPPNSSLKNYIYIYIYNQLTSMLKRG